MLGKKAQAQKSELVLCGLSGMVDEVLEESGIKEFFTVYETIEMLP